MPTESCCCALPSTSADALPFASASLLPFASRSVGLSSSSLGRPTRPPPAQPRAPAPVHKRPPPTKWGARHVPGGRKSGAAFVGKRGPKPALYWLCLLYTSDAADE